MLAEQPAPAHRCRLASWLFRWRDAVADFCNLEFHISAVSRPRQHDHAGGCGAEGVADHCGVPGDGINPQWFWQFDAGNTCNPGSLPQIHFYFQRAGDDMSGAGNMQFYRWWSRGYDIEPAASYTLTIGLTPGDWWSSVYGVNAVAQPLMFQQAKDNASSVGFTFGGGCFAGHGVALKGGNATMTLRSFVVQ